jgi:hypothetical protein
MFSSPKTASKQSLFLHPFTALSLSITTWHEREKYHALDPVEKSENRLLISAGLRFWYSF